MIEIKKVNKIFNKRKRNQIKAIDETTLTFERTGLTALLGASGSGKTTLLNVIGGLDKVTSGTITIDGKRITKRRSGKVDDIRNISVGYIFQNFKLLEDKSVMENVEIVLRMIGIKDKNELKERCEYVLDKVGMLRYKKRLASALSGGQRQRVAIARALVKDPSIILADEPTGNLDSKNTIEVMNIIKEISKERLVILVTHERNLAEYYASRVIEISDGRVFIDYENSKKSEFHYSIDNNIYLGDFNSKKTANGVNIYTNDDEKIKLDIVFKDGSIYIKNSDFRKIEIVDENSNIEFIEGTYKPITQDSHENMDFQIKKLDKSKLKYSSILGIKQIFSQGFGKIGRYTILKKLSLLGYGLASAFVIMAIAATIPFFVFDDEDFVKYDSQYLISENQISDAKINELSQNDLVEYILPGDSLIGISLVNDEYYEFAVNKLTIVKEPSISSLSEVEESDIIQGRLPEGDKEIVIDSLYAKQLFKEQGPELTNVNINSVEDFIGKKIMPTMHDNFKYEIVGITNKGEPSLYFADSQILNVINYARQGNESANDMTGGMESFNDYTFVKSDIEITKGEAPEEGEVLIKTQDVEIGNNIKDEKTGEKLEVSGYYSSDHIEGYVVTSSEMEKNLYDSMKGITVSVHNKEQFLEGEIQFKDPYFISKKEYKEDKIESMKPILIFTIIALVVSFIEIFLILRSSFLARVKEVGTLRAIGVKKKDIYKMFCGEIIAITIVASVPGILLMAYIVYNINNLPYMDGFFVVNSGVILFSIGIIFLFNMIVGLFPVFNTIRKTPTEILARNDV